MTPTHRRGRSSSSRNARSSSSHTWPSSRHQTNRRSHQKRRPFKKDRAWQDASNRNTRSAHRGGGRRGGRRMPSFDPSQFINTNPVNAAPEVYLPKHRFDTFGLDERIVRAIRARNMTVPTPIQDQIIPEILKGHDVIGLAETGTGKTAAFLIPLIQKTIKERRRQTLILTPTRELALQIEAELQSLARGMHIASATCVGGVGIGSQIRSLRRVNQFIVGTPGRILDLIKRGDFKTRSITSVVLDEADRMLDMGFIRDMRAIIAAVPKERETLFFSATITNDVKQLMHEFLRNPITVSVKKKDVIDSIEQDIVHYIEHKKFETLLELLARPESKRVLIFGSMKHSVERLARQLRENGVDAESIHGNKSHGQRQRALQKFKMNQARVLVATDVAARGIHVEDVSHVINYDLPSTFEDYVHRIGRTGRGTKRGKALTFVTAR